MTTKNQPAELSPHRQRKHDQMVQKILNTARQIMREEGVAALSMHELARRLDLRAPSLYNYFDGTMALYDALFRLGFGLYAERTAEAGRGAQTWQEEIRRQMEAYLAFAIENPDLYQLCFERPVPAFVPSEASLAFSLDLLNQSYARVEQLPARQESGLETRQVVDMVIAIMHGLSSLHLANEPHLPLGQGGFGSLIPAFIQTLDRAWAKK